MPSENTNPRTRPVFKRNAPDDQEKFKPLPPPTGAFPYRLNIAQVIPGFPQDELAFHMAGDTGSLHTPEFQIKVAGEMAKQYQGEQPPRFMFHLGDVVYNFGQAAKYYTQFFHPYEQYPAPVFAISGNHDADIDLFDEEKPESLKAFRRVFCDTESRPIPFANGAKRLSNIQPNIYWTLQTPLADIIGLYSNVPKFGTITAEQKEWFIEELKNSASQGKAIIVCIHHAPYSADINHGSSIHMMGFLNDAFAKAGVLPDIVLSGHVHNYQRFIKTYADGRQLPFIVAGAGGYADLHPIAQPNDLDFPDQSTLLDGVKLQNYCTHTHGFLKIAVTKQETGLQLKGDYYTVALGEGSAEMFDSFTMNIDPASR